MRVVQLHAENIKRIKAIDITPDDNVVVLSGMNGEGKTSALDCIWLASKYAAAKKGNPSPLRAGEDKGEISLDLGDYIVNRKFTQTGTTLEIKKPNGDKIASPQKLLDGFIGNLSFDPWEFSRKTEKDQKEMLADILYDITEGELDLASFDAKHKEAFTARTDANREKKRLMTSLAQLAPPTDADPDEEIAVADITKSISETIEVQSRTNQLLERERVLSLEIKDLEQRLEEAKKEHQGIARDLQAMPETPDLEFLQGELANIEKTNKRAREVIAYRKTKTALDDVDAEIKSLNDTMELIEIEKSEALEESPLPVNGLRVTPDGIMVINEDDLLVPFCQASAAQRLRISLGIAMAANPTLRVIRISDGSLLDDESMRIVKEMADTEDFQVWIEYASRNDSDRMGVYIEDGQVASD